MLHLPVEYLLTRTQRSELSFNMTETFVKSFTHLKDMPKADRALPMLQRMASLVKPIMRKHGWILPTLAEFFPDSPNLLGGFKLFILQVIHTQGRAS